MEQEVQRTHDDDDDEGEAEEQTGLHVVCLFVC